MKERQIRTTYDAYWFLVEHPKMRCREARLISAREAKKLKPEKRYRIRRVNDNMPWASKKTYLLCEHPLYREAMPENLDIFWAMVDERGRVNKDDSKNRFSACWLEFGPISYVVSGGRLHVQHSHDIDLDCGAPTFDEALIKLARLVKKHYGPIKEVKRKRGSP